MESESSRAETPVISPDLVGLPPRKVQLTGNGVTLAVVTAVIIAMAVIYPGFVATEAVRQAQIRTALRSASNETVGTIEQLRSPYPLKNYVDYTFIADGKTYTGEAIVPLEFLHSVRLTGNLFIRYLPENPAVNHPVDWEWSTMSLWENPYWIPIFFAGLGCILFIPSQLQFERRMAAEGIATIGVVTKCSVSGKGGSYITLRYDFRTQDGSSLQGRGRFQTRQEIGTNILILYLPQRPRKNIPYPVSTWHIAKR